MNGKEFNPLHPVPSAGERNPHRGFFCASRRSRAACAVLALAGATLCSAQPAPEVDLTSLPIEKLMEMEVTILRGHETLSKTPAAVSIVTQEDIRRSGATSIPEALRLVPGLEVARVDASQWPISPRGF